MNPKIRFSFRHVTLFALVAVLFGCGVVATPYLWRSYAGSENLESLGAGVSVCTAEGNTFQLLPGSNGSLLRQVDSSGAQTWQVEFPGQIFNTMIQAGSGVLVGDANLNGTLVSGNGDLLWSQSLKPENSVTLRLMASSDRVFIAYHTPGESEFQVNAFDSGTGALLWSESIGGDNGQAVKILAAAVTKHNGETLWIIRRADNSGNALLDTRLLDANGQTLAQQVKVDEFAENSSFAIHSLGEGHVLNQFDADNGSSLLIGLDGNGAEIWRTAFAGHLFCDAGAATTLGCLRSGTTDDSLVWINSDTGAVMNSVAGNFPVAIDLLPNSDGNRIRSNGNGQWIVMTARVPALPSDAVQAKTERPFYMQFLVYSEAGKKLKTITMNPGYVTYIYELIVPLGQSHWRPYTTQTGDKLTHFDASADVLTVAGYDGYYGSAAPGTPVNKFVTAYRLQ